MRVPIRPVPDAVVRWTSLIRWCRWVDAAIAWLLLWSVVVAMMGSHLGREAVVVSVGLVCLGMAIHPIRARWRPLTGWIGLALSRSLRAGDRAWYIGGREARLVLVTARHGVRLVVAHPDFPEDEGMSVRRTRVLLLPLDRS